jgi:hypothetical protein
VGSSSPFRFVVMMIFAMIIALHAMPHRTGRTARESSEIRLNVAALLDRLAGSATSRQTKYVVSATKA